MSFVRGDRVRLIKSAPVRDTAGPPIGTVSTVIACELPATHTQSPIWRVQCDDFSGQFHALFEPGIWFVVADEIELLMRE